MTMYFHSTQLIDGPFAAASGAGMVPGSVSVSSWGDTPEFTLLSAKDAKTNLLPVDLVWVSDGAISPKDGGGTYLNLTGLDPAHTVTEIRGRTATDAEVIIQVDRRRQLTGFAPGRHWMFPIDKTTGLLKIRKGRKGRKFYVTRRPRADPNGKGGYDRAQIAAADGVSVSNVTNTYITNSLKWGRSEDFPLEMNTGFSVWGAASSVSANAANANSSGTLLLECGYEYNDGVFEKNRGIVSRKVSGESPMHPFLVTSYGVGENPYVSIQEFLMNFQTWPVDNWIAFQGVDASSFQANSGFVVLCSHMALRHRGWVMPAKGVGTLYRCAAINPSVDPPVGDTDWGFPAPHTCGVYGAGMLVLESALLQSGWRDGYNPDSNSTEWPHPPSGLAHGAYLQFGNPENMFRRNFILRSASMSIQARASGTFTDNLLADANIAGNDLGRSVNPATGLNDTAGMGSFGCYLGDVYTSAACRDAEIRIYATCRGVDVGSFDAELGDLIFMHAYDPNNPTEFAEKSAHGLPPQFHINPTGVERGARIDLVRSWNWAPGQDNAEQWGADPAVLNQTTLQIHAANVMSQPTATLQEYDYWLRTLSFARRAEELDKALQFFRTPWGLHVPKRVNPSVCVFQPHPRTSGVLAADRWNWNTQDTPGDVDGDSVEGRGVNILWGEITADLDYYDAQNGHLDMSSGYLKANELRNCPKVTGSYCAELHVGTAVNVPEYQWNSGTLVFNGAVSGHDLRVDGQFPEVLLGPDHRITAGKVLDIRCGAQGAVGWDHEDDPVLTIEAGGTLRLRAYDGVLSRIEVYRSGFWDEDAPTAQGTVILAPGAVLEVETEGQLSATLNWPGVTVVNEGAIMTAGVSVSDGKVSLVVS